MIISPFTVYLILQADSIRVGIGVALGLAAAIKLAQFLILATALEDARSEDKEKIRPMIPRFTTVILLVLSTCLAVAIIPSTATLAGTIIAPAIANSSVIQKDIPELYSLGVQAIKETLTKK